MYITKQLVEQMGGSVGMHPAASGKGSVFWFAIELPYFESPTTAIIPKKDEPSVSFVGHVLVVDDNSVNRLVASRTLKKLGLNVDEATTGIEAVETAINQPFDLILMDIKMPGIDGLEAAKRIRKAINQDCPPIIAWSANSSDGDIANFIAGGIDGILAKPVDEHAVVEMLHRHLPQG